MESRFLRANFLRQLGVKSQRMEPKANHFFGVPFREWFFQKDVNLMEFSSESEDVMIADIIGGQNRTYLFEVVFSFSHGEKPSLKSKNPW